MGTVIGSFTYRWDTPVGFRRLRLRSSETGRGYARSPVSFDTVGVGFVTNPHIDRRRSRLVPTSARTRGRHGIGARSTHPQGGPVTVVRPSAPECRRWRINLMATAQGLIGFVVCLPRRMLRCLGTGDHA